MARETNHGKCALVMPSAYQGQVPRRTSNPSSWTVIEAATFLELPPLLERHGIWAISRDGLHSLVLRYDIPRSRLYEEDWEEHMEGKDWVDPGEFRNALYRARSLLDAGYLKRTADRED